MESHGLDRLILGSALLVKLVVIQEAYKYVLAIQEMVQEVLRAFNKTASQQQLGKRSHLEWMGTLPQAKCDMIFRGEQPSSKRLD